MRRALILERAAIVFGVIALVATAGLGWHTWVDHDQWVVAPIQALSNEESAELEAAMRARLQLACGRCELARRPEGSFGVRIPALSRPRDTAALLTTPGHFSMRFAVPVDSDNVDSDNTEEDASELLPGHHTAAEWYRPTSPPILENDHIDDAYVSSDDTRKYAANALVSPEGTVRLSSESAEHVGEFLVLTLDGTVMAAPRLSEPLTISSISWTSEQGDRSDDQYLADLIHFTALMRVPRLPYALRVVERP